MGKHNKIVVESSKPRNSIAVAMMARHHGGQKHRNRQDKRKAQKERRFESAAW